jgi:predicted GIY-YIG superfamily endonuclease
MEVTALIWVDWEIMFQVQISLFSFGVEVPPPAPSFAREGWCRPPKPWRRRTSRIVPASFGWQAIMYYTYVLESLVDPQRHYIGHTQDLRKRLSHHNDGQCPHTVKFKPWKVKMYLAFESIELARNFERYLKSGSGHAFAHKRFGL